MVFYSKNLLIFVDQHMRQTSISTQIIQLGLHWKIDEVQVDLSPCIKSSKIGSLFPRKNSWGLNFRFRDCSQFLFLLGYKWDEKKTITYLFKAFSRSLDFFQNWLNFFTNLQVNHKKATNSAKCTFGSWYGIYPINTPHR